MSTGGTTDGIDAVEPNEGGKSEHRDAPVAHEGSRLRGAATAVVALSLLSSGLGLLRDLSLAGLFGASSDTDAFLVAWTIPETATPLLMEGAMTYLLVPVLVAELSRAGSVARVVRLTLLPYLIVMALFAAGAAVAAPFLVDILAPGVGDRSLAIRCFRVACLTLFFMGFAGYLMATLRAHERFIRPASAFAAFNIGILATMYALHSRLGVFSAAIGLAVGGALMAGTQLRQFARLTSLRDLRVLPNRRLMIAATSFVPIAAYTIGRQAQVFVERVVGSLISPGAISYMNYASKVAQVPMLLATTAAAVAFPSLARAAGAPKVLGARMEHELRRAILLILPAVAFLVLFSESTVQLLFERGAFQSADTEATAGVLRLYSLGLLGQVLTGVGALVHFSRPGRSWVPAWAAAASLAVTIILDIALMQVLGVAALAVGNAAGITVAAIVMLGGLRRVVSWHYRQLVHLLLLATPLALVASGSAWFMCRTIQSGTMQVVIGGAITMILYLVLSAVAGIPECKGLTQLMLAIARRGIRRPTRGRRR